MKFSYQPASFGGAPFFVAETSDAFGRRGAHHEFPYKDRGLWDDLGGKDGQREIEGYLTSWSPGGLEAARAALIAALQKGEGELVHPWLGRHKVVCTDYSLAHSARELGVCRLTMTFIDADFGQGGSGGLDPAAALFGGVGAALGAAASLFGAVWNLQGVQNFVAALGLGSLAPIFNALNQAFAFAQGAYGAFERFRDLARQLFGGGNSFDFGSPAAGAVGDLQAGAESLSGPELARQTLGLCALLVPAEGSAEAALSRLSGLWAGFAGSMADGAALALPAATAVSSARIANNDAAAAFLGLSAAGLLSAALLPWREFRDQAEVRAAQDELLSRFDLLDELAGGLAAAIDASDGVSTQWGALGAVRRAALLTLAAKMPGLGRPARRVAPDSFPSLFVTYEIYEGLEREPEIVRRNHIRHPGFLPAGELEFLIYA